MSLCECGCGQPAPVPANTSRKQGRVKGQPMRFIHGHNKRDDPCPEGCTCQRHRPRKTVSREDELARMRARQLERRYGIYTDDLDRMFAAQQGRCYLCDRAISREVTARRGKDGRVLRDFRVDHDHSCCPGKDTCGKCVLGLTCNTCNAGCGQFGDDPYLMMQVAQRRLERTRAHSLAREEVV